MIDIAPTTLALLCLWGTAVGLDLVSVPQVMLSRPLVAGTVAGCIVGDVEAGLRVGAVLELFALDVLPIGAVRYPDYGPATVAAVAAAGGAPGWQLGLGVAVAVGLATAALGGWGMQVVRRGNAEAIRRRSAALAAGDAAVIRRLQYLGLARDALRALAVTAVGLLVAGLATRVWAPDRVEHAAIPSLVAVAAGLAAAGSGALRSAGRGLRLRWLLAGAAAGTAWVVLR